MFELGDFDYRLPKELIAQYPLKKRAGSRLLVLDRKSARISHVLFEDLGKYLNNKDALILNNTKVLSCRIFGRRQTGGKVEFFLLGSNRKGVFSALISPGRVKIGERIILSRKGAWARVLRRNEVAFNISDPYSLGVTPLPPYIKRDANSSDKACYQTVYARIKGALAAPTAGLHFTKRMLNDLAGQGVGLAYLTLHVGIGTFGPVKCPDIRRHKMEPEEFAIPKRTVELIRQAKKNKKRVIAVGTTSLRAMESASSFITDYRLPITNYRSSTNLFIYPGYKFKIADCLLTNFHLPKSTLFMLACAFAGSRMIKSAYQEAIDRRYRFYSYGDAMLIV